MYIFQALTSLAILKIAESEININASACSLTHILILQNESSFPTQCYDATSFLSLITLVYYPFNLFVANQIFISSTVSNQYLLRSSHLIRWGWNQILLRATTAINRY